MVELLESRRCRCPCHDGSVTDRWRGGVSVLDVVEAAVACARCLERHCPALLSRRNANELDPMPKESVPYQDSDIYTKAPPPGDEGEGPE